MKTNTKLAAAFLAAASSIAVQAADAPAPAFTTTGNLAFTNDYVFRGVTQNAGRFAVQGGFDVAHASGLSAGVWASNVAIGNATMELDVYGAYGFKVGGVDVSVGYIAYAYEGQHDANFEEANLALTYAGLTLKASKGIAGVLNTSDYYLEANYAYDVPQVKGLSLGLHYGSDRSSKNDDYAIAASYPVFGLVGTVSYSDIQNGSSITAFTLKKVF